MATSSNHEHIQVDVYGEVVGQAKGRGIGRGGGHVEPVAVDVGGDRDDLFHPAEAGLAGGGDQLPQVVDVRRGDRWDRDDGVAVVGHQDPAGGEQVHHRLDVHRRT